MGSRVTGNRPGRTRGAGWAFVHVAVDEATRRAFAGVPGDPRKTTAFLLPALRWFGPHGIGAERVITYNARAARMPLRLGMALAGHPPFTRPCTPKTNAKAERFIQTLPRDWVYGLAHPS